MNRKHWLGFFILAAACGFYASGCRTGSLLTGGRRYDGAEKVLLPGKGWTCGMPAGIPVPERGVPVLEASLLGQVYDLGRTPYGPRKVMVTQAGNFHGAKILGAVMTGGLDFQLQFSNGTMEVEQIFVLRTDDGAYIYLHGLGTGTDPSDVRMVFEFEAPNGSAARWLNTGQYVGRREIDYEASTIKITVFDVSTLAVAVDPANSVQVTKPSGVLDQPSDYRRAAPGEKRGEQLIRENVTLGASQSVGATKNKNRNIIPITGGTLSGKITGKVLAGGADYQNLSNPATIDARYLWQTDDGEVIIVRNAGPFASLVPTFEVRLDSKYAWLNTGKYLSSNPGVGAGGVGLTFYDSAQ